MAWEDNPYTGERDERPIQRQGSVCRLAGQERLKVLGLRAPKTEGWEYAQIPYD